MPRTYLIIVLSLLCFAGVNCSAGNNKPDSDRVSMLKKEPLTDELLISFYKYVDKYDLYDVLIEYEKSEVKDYTDETFIKHMTRLGHSRCISQEMKDRLLSSPDEFNSIFIDYDEKVNKSEAPETAEYRFLNGLYKAGVPDVDIALSYAMEDLELTLHKRYFYLFYSMPSAICEEYKSDMIRVK